jgi:hypothetical protein
MAFTTSSIEQIRAAKALARNRIGSDARRNIEVLRVVTAH